MAYYDPSELDSDFDSMDDDDGTNNNNYANDDDDDDDDDDSDFDDDDDDAPYSAPRNNYNSAAYSASSSSAPNVASVAASFSAMRMQPAAPTAKPTPPPVPANGMCYTCSVNSVRAAYSPFCTYTCKERWERAQGSSGPSTPQSSAPRATTGGLCVVCGIKPAYSQNGKTYPTCGKTCATALKNNGGAAPTGRPAPSSNSSGLCVVCGIKPPYKTYPTCGNTCANILKTQGAGHGNAGTSGSHRGAGGNTSNTTGQSGMCAVCGIKPTYKSFPTCGNTCRALYEKGGHRGAPHRAGGGGGGQSHTNNAGGPLCVVCNRKSVYQGGGGAAFATCSLTCLGDLCNGVGFDKAKCDYCHRRPKLSGSQQCSTDCATKAKQACLMCRARPKLGKYHFCGKTCRQLSLKGTPRLCGVPKGHVTWDMVEKKFQAGWKDTTQPCPPLLHVYKIVESMAFHDPYTKHKNQVGNEHFAYHGVPRQCKLGEGTTILCNNSGCAACNILKTSFNIAFARADGAFGAGIYTSTAVNKAEVYSGKLHGSTGAMLLNKVVLGKPYRASRFKEVTSLPSGHDSLIFDNEGGKKNETIVYNNNAIRPVFFLVF